VAQVVTVQGLAQPGPTVPLASLAATDDEGTPTAGTAAQWITASLGGGVLLDEQGHVATAAHVLDGAQKIGVVFDGNQRARAQVVGLDPLTDLALLKIATLPPGVRPLTLGGGEEARVGDRVLVIGNPDGLPLTLTGGRVSGLHRRSAEGQRVYHDYLQTDAALFPGCSGGPLLDDRGRVLGLVISIDRERRGVGFALPSHRAKPLLDQLIGQGRVVRGWIGVTAKDLEAEVERLLGLRRGQGAQIWRLVPGTPGEQAGLRPGDVVLEVAGQPVEGRRDLAWAIALAPPGRELKLKVLRGKEQREHRVLPVLRPEPLPEGAKNAF
jgi:serine protease DegQ